MKTKQLLGLIFIAPMVAVALTGCGNKTRVGGSKVIQIKAFRGSYDTQFIHQMAEKFHAIYPEISFEYVEESASYSSDKCKQEIANPKNNQVDLYFVTGLDVDALIRSSYSALKTRDVVLLEPLDDVFESHAIAVDGSEETQTIKERFYDGFEEACIYNGSQQNWKGKMYFLPWADACTGLFANQSVLDRFNIETPLTSNELTAAVQTIYNQGKSQGILPFSYAGSNAVGYWEYLYETWFAQYTGVENFEKFMNCDPGNGKIKEEGYKVYQDQGILKALEAMDQILDLKYCPSGSAQKNHIEATSEFVRGKTAFMCDGEWIFNEMKTQYYDYAQNLRMIGAPVLSSIGEQIGITDSQLHDLVGMIDDHKTNEEIKIEIPALTDSNIEWVREARSTHDSIGVGHTICIPSYSDAKDAAKLFLRFFYSNDGCRIFRNSTYGNLPLRYETKEGDTNTEFQRSLDKVHNYDNAHAINSCGHYNSVRDIAQIFLFNNPSFVHPGTFQTIMLDKYQKGANYVLTPQYVFEKEAQYIRSKWSEKMVYITYL